MGELAITTPLTIIGPGANLLTISGNNASRVFFIDTGNTVTLDGLTVSGGNGAGAILSNNGAGILNIGTLTLTNSTVYGNGISTNSVQGGSGQGGGILNIGTLTLTNSTVSGNSALYGGGIANNGGTVKVTNSTVSGNSTLDFGGGIFNSGMLTLTNSTISGNSAASFGGGIHNPGGTVKVTNSTITSNRTISNVGGGIYAGGTETLNNTIVAGNFRSSGTTPDDINGGTIDTANNNLIGNAATPGGITNGANGNIVGVSVSTVLDTTLANNGGPTKTHALLAGSPAINAGSNTLAVDASNQPLTNDQRGTGFPRISGGTVDVGAFEVQVVLPSLSINDVSQAEGNAGTTTFTFTVSLSSPAPAGGVSFDIATADGTATAGSDYATNSLMGQTILAGSSTYLFSVTVNGNTAVEPDKTFFVNVTNVTGATVADDQGRGMITNDDVAGVTITQSGGSTDVAEGGATDSYTLVLNTQPTANVTISFDTGTQLQSISSRTFTSANWSMPQTITVAAVDDNVIELSPHFGTISHTATSSDPNYNGISIASVTVSITDNDSATGFNFTGFFQPVDNAPTINVATAGSAIPVKFSLGGYQGMAIFWPGYPVSQMLPCSSSSSTDVIEETVLAGSSSLSYDATTDQYKYVWKTEKAWKGQCRKLVLKLSDGSTHEARFQFK